MDADQLLYTKFLDWQYEEAWRSWIQIDDRDPAGLYFYNCDYCVQLREVIVGPLCDVPEAKLNDALRDNEDNFCHQSSIGFQDFSGGRESKRFSTDQT